MSAPVLSQPYNRNFNFSAGPCTLPVEVLEEARDGIMNWNGSGASVMELSHRSKAFEGILAEAMQDARDLLAIPDNYKVVFLQGGATMQFTMFPMVMRPSGSGDFVVTGTWGKKALDAAKLDGGEANVIFDAKGSNWDHAPRMNELTTSPDAKFVHFTSNETIQGVDFQQDPEAGDVKWVCDMSSNIMSRPIDVSKYAYIYAGAQKNMGPAGATLLIVRDDVIADCPTGLPPAMDLKLQVDNDGMYNTPPCWSIYMCGLVYKWLKRNGGLEAMAKTNEAKAKLIYDAIDATDFYRGHAQLDSRSLMNIAFNLPSDELLKMFLAEAKAEGMVELQGHRLVGGCRASIYNAFPTEGAKALADFMTAFAAKNG
jgi:phosphoserine aminotransferase